MSGQEAGSAGRAVLLGQLEFGRGKIGESASFDESEIGLILGDYVRPLTVHRTADCVDGRPIVSLADPSVSQDAIHSRVAEQMPGGLVFAVTCAAVGANMAIVRDAKDFKQAYLTMYEILTSLGYEDGGHAHCGASTFLEQSVEHEVELDAKVDTIGAIRPGSKPTSQIAKQNRKHKKELLLSGFYSKWDNHFHEEFLFEKAPHNFATLESDDTPLAGHYEKLVLAVSKSGYGLAKNPLVSETGHMAFGLTTSSPTRIIEDIGPRIKASDQELARFLYEFDASGLDIFNILTAKGIKVYTV